jgi:hypothetical protein
MTVVHIQFKRASGSLSAWSTKTADNETQTPTLATSIMFRFAFPYYCRTERCGSVVRILALYFTILSSILDQTALATGTCCVRGERIQFVVCFLLGNSPASEVYMPTFRNTLFYLHRQVGVCRMNWVRGMLVYHRGRCLARK